jgi:hypothetical protein
MCLIWNWNIRFEIDNPPNPRYGSFGPSSMRQFSPFVLSPFQFQGLRTNNLYEECGTKLSPAFTSPFTLRPTSDHQLTIPYSFTSHFRPNFLSPHYINLICSSLLQ